MNRSVVYLGAGVVLFGIVLVASPIALTGAEQFDLAQEMGFLVAPIGLVVVMLGASFYDPSRTTIGGAFGNPDEGPTRAPGPRGPPRPAPPVYHPYESVNCRFCRTHIEAALANCPRCARARECRTCSRPLGRVLDRATCPLCARPEPLCNCPRLAPRPATTPPGVRPGRRL
ncbi:MAG: hypothetical protein WBG19_04950 [Thermoplasmata archaeon]